MGKEGGNDLENPGKKKKKNVVHKGKDFSSVNPFWSYCSFICGQLTKTNWMATPPKDYLCRVTVKRLGQGKRAGISGTYHKKTDSPLGKY